MKTLKLVYYKGVVDNLGDWLSPYIINKLSGMPIQWKYVAGVKSMVGSILKLLCCRISVEKFNEVLFPFESNLIGVGSVITWGNHKSVVWGSGFMNWNERFKGGKVCAVRGKLTQEKLLKDGFMNCDVLGDPALLLPLLIKPNNEKKKDIAIIPHWTEYNYFVDNYGGMYDVLDIRTSDVENFISTLTSYSHILSTSLHGIILSHSYGIPALWIKQGDIGTDGFKFYDYFSSVNIPFYKGITDFDALLNNGEWRVLFTEYRKFAFPQVDIKQIQRALINAAPFYVQPQYKYSLSKE